MQLFELFNCIFDSYLNQYNLSFSPQGLLYFNSKLKMLERRQQQVKEVRAKHQVLLEELEDTKARLMMDPSKWIGECKSLPLRVR